MLPTPLGSRRSVLALVVSVLLCLAACDRSAVGRPDVLLITIDTMRADHLGVYGYPRATTPRIDELAGESLVFDLAFTPIPKTTPALFSLLTGLDPKSHRVTSLGQKIDPRVPMIQEDLRRSGYRTAAICGQYNCSGSLGFERGFDLFDDEFRIDPAEGALPRGSHAAFRPEAERRAEDVADAAIAWLREAAAGAQPFFLWAHFMDPHGAYDAPEAWRNRFQGPPPFADRSVHGPDLPQDRIHPQVRVAGLTDYSAYLDRYDEEVSYTDHHIGRVLDEVRDLGRFETALVIVTADHGEIMGESRDDLLVFSHGGSLLEPEIRVPLVVRLPGGAKSSRSSDLASLSDLPSTIAAYAGLGEWSGDGRPLPGAVRRAPEPRDEVFVQLPGGVEHVRSAKTATEGGPRLGPTARAGDPAPAKRRSRGVPHLRLRSRNGFARTIATRLRWPVRAHRADRRALQNVDLRGPARIPRKRSAERTRRSGG